MNYFSILNIYQNNFKKYILIITFYLEKYMFNHALRKKILFILLDLR